MSSSTYNILLCRVEGRSNVSIAIGHHDNVSVFVCICITNQNDGANGNLTE